MSAEYPVKIVQDLASKLYNDFEQLWDFAPQTKLQCLVNSAARLLLLPLVLLHEAAILPSRIIYDEMAHQHLGALLFLAIKRTMTIWSTVIDIYKHVAVFGGRR